MPHLRRIFYVSRARPGLVEGDVQAILEVSRRNNRRRDITGSLMFSGAHFGQTLEGRVEELGELLARLALDPRHSDVRVAFDGPITTRAFERWSMAYVLRLELAEELERLVEGAVIAPADEALLLRRFSPDSVIGEL